MFVGPDGKPLSAAQFIETLYGELPALLQDEAQLHEIWSDPITRKGLMDGLAERGFGGEQLADIRKLTKGEDSDLFDVLAYIAYARPTVTRQDRVTRRRDGILSHYDEKTREFLEFVLSHYVEEGVDQLDVGNLKGLLTLKYGSTHDAAARMGGAAEIRQRLLGFRKGYIRQAAMPAELWHPT